MVYGDSQVDSVDLSSDDLLELATLVRDLNFDDTERRDALLENGSRDFNAVPGGGKTSLLASKLLLLAKKWPHTRRGICILSHTNVARDEIARRLAATAEGAQLLSYPHFIGTIHSFVNQFFALPILRSFGLKVDVIDDQVFADKANSLLQQGRFSKLRFYLQNQHNGEQIATTLFYRTAKREVHVEKGRLPSTHTASFKALMDLKQTLTEKGIFRHRDMFAYANLALDTCPHLLNVVHRRFPMVFIDEMQDTSWEQESFLNSIFDGKSVMQRFGDIDQKILSDEKHVELLTFPKAGYGCISTSKRFGQTIADAVGCVRVSGDPVVGEGVVSQAPTLLLYSTADVTKVVSHYGRMVIDRLTEDDIGGYEVKAMSARKTGEGNAVAGRHILDYWPSYEGELQRSATRSESFWSLICDTRETLREASLSSRVYDVRRALLLVLRATGASLVQDIHDARALPKIANAIEPAGTIEKLTRQLALSSDIYRLEDQRDTLIELLYKELKPYLPDTLELDAFKVLSVFDNSGQLLQAVGTTTSTMCEVNYQGRILTFGLGTIAGMKGETHSSSLVLESYGGKSRKFDVSFGLEYIAGLSTKALSQLPKTQQTQMRSLYVAMSRPTTFLCLAANESRVSERLRKALAVKGWHIEIVT